MDSYFIEEKSMYLRINNYRIISSKDTTIPLRLDIQEGTKR
jgi:hypothetical protein